MSLQLRFVSHSEVGLVRKNNQDSGYASPQLLVVADGMGGAAAGDLASAVAIDTIKGLDAGPPTDTGSGASSPLLERLSSALRRANDRIAELIADDYTLEGMGTTVTGALFDGERLSLAHIGDSRAYLLRDGRLERLTHDHSWVQSLVDDGKISEAEATVHPHRSLLLKVLNGQPANEPDLTTVQLRAGDRLLFCSDGVCGLVEDEAISEALRVPDLDQAMTQLVDHALSEGGIDNITAIVADVVDGSGGGTTAVLGAAAERTIPPVGTRGRSTPGANEDTLIRNRPAAIPTAATGDAEDEARYNPQPPRKRRVPRALVGVLALVLIVGVGLGAGYAWTRSQYFVGAVDDRVAIYQGLPAALPGINLSSVYEVQPLPLSSLPAYYQNMITTGIEVNSLEAARQTVAELTETARRCAQSSPKPTASPKPTPRPSAAPRPAPTATPRSKPPTPRPSVIGPTVPSTSPAANSARPTTPPASSSAGLPSAGSSSAASPGPSPAARPSC